MTETVLQFALLKTDKSDKTYMVSNHDFLKTVFSDILSSERPVIVSFKGNPGTAPEKVWFGRPWTGCDLTTDPPADANNYFSLAVFRPDESGKYRRIKSRFQALYAVMLDDVGSKVPLERLTLPPSWLLETSPGNCQAGYLLRNPLSDGSVADHLMNAVIAAGLCDPGASGPRTRLARLPVAVNGKHSPAFACRMLKWSPELRYRVEELIGGLQLDLQQGRRGPKQEIHVVQDSPVSGDPVWIPRPEDNAVLVAIRNRGFYKVPLGEGKHSITCPWVQEHTDGMDSGTVYFEPDDLWPIGGFKCQHGHCSSRHIKDLLRLLEIDPNMARMKPTIRVIPGEMNRVVDAAERELAQLQRYYQRGGLIVTVVTDPGTAETHIMNIGQQALVRLLASAATWEHYDARSRVWLGTDPPTRHAAVLFDSFCYPHLPVLNGLARQPYLRSDGSLMNVAGYDPSSGMFGAFEASEYHVPESPTLQEAKLALELLIDLLAEFSFYNASDLAATLAAMLTAAIRPSLPHAPMFHIMAHAVGSGKSYLCELIITFATPQRGTPTTFPADDEECRKMLLAGLLRVPAVIEFDNLTCDLLAHKSLCTVLSSEFMSGRILGMSKITTVSTRVLFLSSGNNVGPIQDMTRRCITIRLDPECEVPAARNFKRPDLVREVLRERARYVSAALTIVRAWITANRPKTMCKPLAGYADWCELCRQPLLWLGCADPAASVFEAMTDDPDRGPLDRLLAAWQLVFGTSPAMVRDAIRQASVFNEANQELMDVLREIAGERNEINTRKLGRWIKRNCGRIVNGRRFVRASGHRSAEAWRIEVMESVSPVL